MELLLPAWIFVSILIVLALALGVYTLHRYANGPLEHKTIPCNCAQCKAKRAYLTANTGRTLTHVLHALSLTMFVFSVTLAVSLYVGRTRVTDDFDPYSILNVTRTASERTISLSHKRLAKSHSPGTPSESIERAFDILSDRETQECISSFGSVSGLRLPLFGVHIPCDFFRVILIIIGSPIAVGLFALVFFMFTILFISSKKLNETTREVFAHSSSSLYKKYTNDNTRTSEGILAIITASSELEPLIYEDLCEDAEYRKLVKLLERKPFTLVNEDWSHRSNSLAYFHLSRLYDSMSDRLTKSSYLIARNMPTVIERYCLQSDSLFHTLKALKINQCVSQASWNDKPLLQLPHFTNEMVDVCNKEHGIFYPADIFMLGKYSSSKLFDTLGLTPEQVRDVFQVENSVFAVKPKVTYDLPSTVGCSSDVTLEITVSAVGIGVNTDSCSPDFHCEPYFDKEEIEGRNRCCLGKKLKKNLSNASEFGLDECPSESRFSHTPYIMEQNYEKWWFVLGDEESNILLAIEQGKIQRSPDGGDDDDDDESEDDETVKVFIKFKTPAKPGIYNFTLYVVCGTYIGRDVKLNVPVTVDQITLDSFD